MMGLDDDDDKSLPPLGENTDKFLDQAKKGQPRNFLLVCKGNKVKYLAVRKKSIKKNELNDARKQGYKGDGYFGVITGKGMELVFNLSAADGYTSEPVKDKVLKDFLEEKAGFKSKPSFAILSALPDIPFDDEDLKNPLIARFIALESQVPQVLVVNPAAQSELGQSTTEIRGLLLDEDFAVAEPRVNALESRILELLGGSSAPTTTSSSTPSTEQQPTTGTDDLKRKLLETLDKLVPQLKQAVVTYPEKKTELLTPVAQIKKQLDADELDEAKKGIVAFGQLLKTLMTPGRVEIDSPSVQWKKAKLEATRGVALLENVLRDSSDSKAIEIAQIIKEMVARFPSHLDSLLDELEQAVNSKDVETANKRKISAKKAVDDWGAYLKKHEREIAGCENNPWNIPVSISGPINQSLQSIRTKLLA